MSNARRRLLKASHFLELAKQASQSNRFPFADYLEAAIENGRSVTWVLQKEFAHTLGFEEWYEETVVNKKDSMLKFFVDTRDFVVKEGPVPIKRAIHVQMSATISVEAVFSAHLTVVRGKPWYQRPVSILWSDVELAVRERLRFYIRKFRRRFKSQKPSVQQRAVSVEILPYYFQDPAWQAKPAVDLVAEYLAKLEMIVSEAERRFERP